MYFLTAKDPNYIVKGSRDPLGMQVIWQAAGRRLIPDLSTVSSSIIDFQIMCIASYYKKELRIEDKAFQSFFNRLEKLMAFVRFQKNPKEGFNGVDRINKLINTPNKTITISDQQEILSNQKAYGVWGKYNRPFSDAGITEISGFHELMKKKIKTVPAFDKMIDRLVRKPVDQNTEFNKSQLQLIYPLIDKPEGDERNLFIKTLLKDNCENSLYKAISENKNLLGMSLYELIENLSLNSASEELNHSLDSIRRTELILSPLNHIFRYLQTKSYWTRFEISVSSAIEQTRTNVDTEGLDISIQELNKFLTLPNVELVLGLANRNEQVSAGRKSVAWMKMNENGLEVNHFEGARSMYDYNPTIHNDNSYFISSYLNIYRQLH
ncbi:hypothetical protein DBR43_30520 [Pedobacter sp. KBW06]|uniref:hypothetical protein n=1 Tax=Pedobacter sp. KBW06 TaxID=2153359 RepID=UPI000F5B2880|nr:hypothetical protein [Pedobacter sp. KBW06]RQO65191.1 hypothetical protein DBR43_30520 [Pedobacter sp. KBW06]